MMEKSGGMFGFTKVCEPGVLVSCRGTGPSIIRCSKLSCQSVHLAPQDISVYATTARSGQAACFCVGILIFFDDYANCLLAGKSLRPLLDTLFVSREKLAFIVDATAAPIASISPVSSWVGFEIGLIQAEIDRIIELQGTDDIGIRTSGFAVFLQSIKYRYYPIFMLIMIMTLIFSQRDIGGMLVAERKTRVYKRVDGGDKATDKHEGESSEENQPEKDTPLGSWNMLVPILVLVRTRSFPPSLQARSTAGNPLLFALFIL
jgi:Na+/H+ antiporter NhaC